MIEIRNKTQGPIPIMVKSRKSPNSFTTLMIPGMGDGKNVVFIPDEKWCDEIDRLEGRKLITVRKNIPNNQIREGE